jgi:hypothetical protein
MAHVGHASLVGLALLGSALTTLAKDGNVSKEDRITPARLGLPNTAL